jgi:hypothetical protein
MNTKKYPQPAAGSVPCHNFCHRGLVTPFSLSVPRGYGHFSAVYRGDRVFYPLYLSLLGENGVEVSDIKEENLSQNGCDKTCDSSREEKRNGGKVRLAQTKKQAPAESGPSSSIKRSRRPKHGGAVGREGCAFALVSSTPWTPGSDSARRSRRRPSRVQRPPQHLTSSGGSTSRHQEQSDCSNNIKALNGICSASLIVCRSTSDQILTKGREKLPPEPDGASFPSGSVRGVRDGFHLPVPAPRLSLPLPTARRSAPTVRSTARSVHHPTRGTIPPGVSRYLYICPLATCPGKGALLFPTIV